MVGLLLAVGTAAVIGIGAWRVLQGMLTVGDIVLLVSYLAMLYKPLETLAYTAATVQRRCSKRRQSIQYPGSNPRGARQGWRNALSPYEQQALLSLTM